MTLRARLAVFMAVAVGFAVALVAVAAYRSTRDETMGEIDRFLLGRTPITELIEAPDHEPGSGQGSGTGRGRATGSVISDDVVAQVLLGDGTIRALGSSEVALPVGDQDLTVATSIAAAPVLRTITIDGVDYRMLTRRLGPGSALQLARDLTETESILTGLRNRLVFVGAFGALLAGLAGWLLAGRAMRPVRDLTAAAERVATTGALDAAIPVARSDEVGRLAGAFNEMLARLETSRLAQQRLVADASHELRTPLTSLRTNIELLARGSVPEGEREAMLADLKEEVAALGTLVAELVDLATVGRDEEPRVATDLAALVSEVVDRAGRRSSQRFVIALDPRVSEVRPGAVARAVSNLVDNAVKWSPANGEIAVTLDATGIRVADRGPGIPPEDLPFVFQRFYRAPTARSMPGSGLGLAIVAAVAEDHGWTPYARNREGGGAEVGMRFAAR